MMRLFRITIGSILLLFSGAGLSQEAGTAPATEQDTKEKVAAGADTAEASSVAADQPEVAALPDPLTLEYALSLADDPHPDLLLQDARLRQAEAELKEIDSDNAFRAYLDIAAYRINTDTPAFSAPDHNRAGLIVKKTLYDFGHTSDLLDAAGQRITSQQMTLLDARGRRRLAILRAYFDVVLADIRFNQFNEAMAIGFINLDKARNRQELGRETDLRIAEFQLEYEKIRGNRFKSENQQRETRAKLSEVLNRPNRLPSNVVPPDLAILKRKLPEVEMLQQLALDNNHRLKAQRHEVTAAEQDLAAARNGDNPTIQAYIKAYEYDRDAGSTDEISGEVSLNYDLYNPRHKAKIADKLSRLYEARAELQKGESDMRQAVLALWHRIEELGIKRAEMAANLNFRELSLEKSRALYEMEFNTDLGFSMSELTRAQFESMQVDYLLAMAWHQMDLLTGKMTLAKQFNIQQPDL